MKLSEQIYIEANRTMQELERQDLYKYQTDRLSGKVNGLMQAYEIAKNFESQTKVHLQMCYQPTGHLANNPPGPE